MIISCIEVWISSISSYFYLSSSVDYLQYEVDSKSNLKELFSSKDGTMGHNGLVLIDSHIKDLPGLLNSEDSGAKSASKLDRAYLSFNGVKVDGNEHDDKKSENLLKSVLPALVPTLSFNDKTHTTASSGLQPQRTSTTIIRLSITKKSVEEETNELCEYPFNYPFPDKSNHLRL